MRTDLMGVPCCFRGCGWQAVTRAEGEALAKRYRMPFFETSAKKDLGVTEVPAACTRARQGSHACPPPPPDAIRVWMQICSRELPLSRGGVLQRVSACVMWAGVCA